MNADATWLYLIFTLWHRIAPHVAMYHINLMTADEIRERVKQHERTVQSRLLTRRAG